MSMAKDFQVRMEQNPGLSAIPRNQWVTAFPNPNPKESPRLGTNSLKETTPSVFQENFNFSSTYNESSIIRSAICSACIPAKFRSTSSLT